MLLRKLGYYAASLRALQNLAAGPAELAARIVRPRGTLRLRDGAIFRMSDRLDLLILKEIACDDVYGLAELARPSLIVDVGAGLGDFTVLAARRFPDCRVIACEPHPARYELLRENVETNELANVETRPVAVGSQRRFTLYPSRQSARSSVFREKTSRAGVPVDGQRLDSIVRGVVDLLKIDCEGNEVDVLESAPVEALHLVRRGVVEYHTVGSLRTDRPVTELLVAAGFDTRTLPDPYDASHGYVIATRRD